MKDHFTKEEWFSLPLHIRVKWWCETNYGDKMASPELMAEIKLWIDKGKVKT